MCHGFDHEMYELSKLLVVVTTRPPEQDENAETFTVDVANQVDTLEFSFKNQGGMMNPVPVTHIFF
jgi:hypothetical protein